MNILYLCDEYPPGRHGGIGTSVRLLARQMVKLGHRVVVAGLYSPGYGGEDIFNDEGVQVYRYRWVMDHRFLSDHQGMLALTGKKILTLTGIIDRDIKKSLAKYHTQLERLISDHQIDIIEMPDYNDHIRFCRSFIPFPKLSAPVIVKMNGSITYFNREAGKDVPAHIFKMEQHILQQAAAISAASHYTAIKSAEYFSYINKIEVLYNGIDTHINLGNIDKQPLQVIFTGTLVQKKGIYQLAKAWNMVIQQQPGARLLILGKGDRQKVMALLNDNARNTVTFMGHVDTAGLYQHLAASIIAIFPSYAEAFALAPLEAMACGTAVINSNRTSGPELINDGVDGSLADPDDIGQLTLSIVRLLSNPKICTELARKGNEKVRLEFDIVKIARDNLRFYDQVLVRNARSNSRV